MDYEKKYKEAVNKIKNLLDDGEKNGFTIVTYKTDLESIFPELKESEDELTWLTKYIEEEAYSLSMDIRDNEDRIKLKNLQKALAWLEKQGECHISHDDEIMIEQLTEYFTTGRGLQNTNETVVEWLNDVKEKLEKQGEMDMKSYKAAEDEKREFVGDGFIKCYADFQDFKEGETYWLEYVGNDNYNVRSDNLLDKTYHITPCQLYTIFKKMTWLEKQGEKPQGKSAFEAINEEKVDNANKVEPKFKDGDWVVYYRNDSSREVLQVYDIRDGRYYFTDNVHFSWSVKECDEKSHLWTIQDAKDGDVLAEDTCTFIIKKLNHDLTAKIYCCLHDDGDFELNSNLGFDDTCTYPATEEQRDLLFAKMKEAGYEWDADKKKLKLLITNGGDFFETENCEQKPAWSEKDTFKVQRICKYLNEAKYYTDITEVRECMEWLKSLKQRIEK